MTTSDSSSPTAAATAPIGCGDVLAALAMLPDQPASDAVKRHLRQCSRCGGEYRTFRASRAALRSLRTAGADDGHDSYHDGAVSLWPEVERSLLHGERSNPRLKPVRRGHVWPIVVASLCLLAATLAMPQLRPAGDRPERQQAGRSLMFGELVPHLDQLDRSLNGEPHDEAEVPAKDPLSAVRR